MPKSTGQHRHPISSGMPLANHTAHTQFYSPAHIAKFLRNVISRTHRSYPILFASGTPVASHIAHTQFHLPAQVTNSSGMPLASHTDHTHLRAQVANFLRNTIDQPIAHAQIYWPAQASNFFRNASTQPQSSYPILIASTYSQFPQK